MAELGPEPSVVGVARLYAPWVRTLVIDHADAGRGQRGIRRGAQHRDGHGHEHPRGAAALAQVVVDVGH